MWETVIRKPFRSFETGSGTSRAGGSRGDPLAKTLRVAGPRVNKQKANRATGSASLRKEANEKETDRGKEGGAGEVIVKGKHERGCGARGVGCLR